MRNIKHEPTFEYEMDSFSELDQASTDNLLDFDNQSAIKEEQSTDDTEQLSNGYFSNNGHLSQGPIQTDQFRESKRSYTRKPQNNDLNCIIYNETTEQREEKLEKIRESKRLYAQKRRQKETQEQRERRLKRISEYRKRETNEQRQRRIDYNKQWHKQRYRIAKYLEVKRDVSRERIKIQRQNETEEQRIRNTGMRKLRQAQHKLVRQIELFKSYTVLFPDEPHIDLSDLVVNRNESYSIEQIEFELSEYEAKLERLRTINEAFEIKRRDSYREKRRVWERVATEKLRAQKRKFTRRKTVDVPQQDINEEPPIVPDYTPEQLPREGVEMVTYIIDMIDEPEPDTDPENYILSTDIGQQSDPLNFVNENLNYIMNPHPESDLDEDAIRLYEEREKKRLYARMRRNINSKQRGQQWEKKKYADPDKLDMKRLRHREYMKIYRQNQPPEKRQREIEIRRQRALERRLIKQKEMSLECPLRQAGHEYCDHCLQVGSRRKWNDKESIRRQQRRQKIYREPEDLELKRLKHREYMKLYRRNQTAEQREREMYKRRQRKINRKLREQADSSMVFSDVTESNQLVVKEEPDVIILDELSSDG